MLCLNAGCYVEAFVLMASSRSRARVSGDPVLKELYEDLAAEFAHDAACEQNLDSLKNLELESRENPAHK